jgi:error-prone DNA polymerase
MPRDIIHLDADAFFASVEQASDPRLRGKAVAVGGEKRGIIASASYEARKMGIYTPMPTVRARKLCPKLIVLPGDFEKYEQFSRWMFSYAYDFTPDVEICSIDEGYFDLSGGRKPPVDVAETIRQAIRQSLKITVSEGIASNKLVSQIASKLNKPAAFTSVLPGCEKSFLEPLSNQWLPGVGPKTALRLNAAGLTRIGQIAATPIDSLELLLDSAAYTLHQYANGLDERPIIPVRAPAKSYSKQETFSADTTDEEYIQAILRRMADQLMATVRAEGKSIRTLTVKVRYNDMSEDQSSESLPEPTDLETDLYSRIPPLLRQAWKRRVSLRMVCLRFSNVYDGVFRIELCLDRSAQKLDAQRRLAAAIDTLRRESRCQEIVMRGHDLLLRPALNPAQTRTLPSRPPPKETHTPGLQILIRTAPANPVTAPVPLRVRSFYSFLNSTLSVEAIVELAQKYEMPAVAITDTGNLHGAVSFHAAAKKAGIQPIIGSEIIVDGAPVCLYVQNPEGYRNLCRILSAIPQPVDDEEDAVIQRQQRPRAMSDLEGITSGLLAASANLKLAPLFPGRFYQAVPPSYGRSLPAPQTGIPQIAMVPIHYATLEDRWKYDVVQSIRTRTLLRQEHPAKQLTGDYHFHSPAQWRALFANQPRLLDHTREIAQRCSFEMPLGKPQFPDFTPPDGSSARAFLRRLALEGLRRRYPSRFPQIQPQVEEELSLIAEVGYEPYFLAVWDLLQECRRQNIEWITRGSAADSLVCYCLEISGVCPIRFNLYFRRFLNRERMQLNKLPDIDLDFPHDRKDDVIDLILKKYGAAHAAVVGGFSTFQARSAVADVAKVLGVSEFQVRRFTEHFPWMGRVQGIETAVTQSLECQDTPLTEEPYRSALRMAEFLDGFPRHPKMHPCGVVLSRQPMCELTPTFPSNKGYPTTHFDMDAVEAIGLIKMDILAQGGLAVMRDVREMLAGRGVELHLDELEPWTDPKVWDLIASGGARAVHHIESPAMIGLCRQSNVHEIDGLVAIVSVIRPGAANENKKLKFVRRYQGREPITYPHPSLEPCLKDTFGLVVYEEHVLQMCEAFAGLPPGRADVLRRALAKYKQPVIDQIKEEFFVSARRLGRPEETIGEVWELVAGFAGYAFCKAHSVAYGVEAWQSAWIKQNYPAEFMAAVLSNGKGFYDPLVYVLECHRLGIPLLPPSINEPGPMFQVCTINPETKKQAIRVPVTRAKGLTSRTSARLLDERQHSPFTSLRDFYKRVQPPAEEMDILIRAGAFDLFGDTRTAQFWEFQRLRRFFESGTEPGQGWLFPEPHNEKAAFPVPLQEPGRREKLEWENDLFGFPVSGHPLELYDDVDWETYCPISRLGNYPGETVVVCGLVIEQRLHHQVTGELMKFLTLTDWTGMVETELFAPTYRSYGLATVRYPVLEVTATVEPYENGHGYSLRIMRAGKPRTRTREVKNRA